MYSADKYFQLLKGRRLTVQVERKHNHFRNHCLPDVIVNMNSPQILSQDILSGRRMFRPLAHHLLRVLTKTYECLVVRPSRMPSSFLWPLIISRDALYPFALCLFALCLLPLSMPFCILTSCMIPETGFCPSASV